MLPAQPAGYPAPVCFGMVQWANLFNDVAHTDANGNGGADGYKLCKPRDVACAGTKT